jgi:hypothetical protein
VAGGRENVNLASRAGGARAWWNYVFRERLTDANGGMTVVCVPLGFVNCAGLGRGQATALSRCDNPGVFSASSSNARVILFLKPSALACRDGGMLARRSWRYRDVCWRMWLAAGACFALDTRRN